jgi:hypothetical protein
MNLGIYTKYLYMLKIHIQYKNFNGISQQVVGVDTLWHQRCWKEKYQRCDSAWVVGGCYTRDSIVEAKYGQSLKGHKVIFYFVYDEFPNLEQKGHES